MSSNLKNKLTDFSPPPPPKAWDKIAAALDDSLSPTVTEKLYEFQQAPPAKVWDKIYAGLVQDQSGPKVVPFYKRYNRQLKYSGAAVVLILVAFLSVLLFDFSSGTSDMATRNNINPLPPLTKDTSGLNGKEVEVVFTPVEEMNPMPPQRATQNNKPRVNAKPVRQLASRSNAEVVRRQPIDFNLPIDRYMVYSDGQNEPVKLSKKLYEIFACIPEDFSCRQRIQSLQQKLATRAVSSDFTGVLDMLQQLKENQ